MKTLDIASFAIIHFILKLLLAILHRHPKDLSIFRQRRVGNISRSSITYLLHGTIIRSRGFLTIFLLFFFSATAWRRVTLDGLAPLHTTFIHASIIHHFRCFDIVYFCTE
ncbi:hypothetical protein VTN00DRAFT_1210 [Thermoascus crustaceus]|uniref:uncharacterized protein n=1 Tax=Thermoascus crustaceus TaxID=5088 RepID=UPI003742EFD2